MIKNFLKEYWKILFVILIYLIFSIYKINYPGLQYDEVLFANAAWKRIDSVFITKTLVKIPIMVMPYIGALKSWIYFFIFRTFGVSVFSIRVPMIILTAISLFSLYKIIKYFLNKKIALITVSLLVLDSSFISLTRYDVGPNAIEFFLIIMSLFTLMNYLKTKNKKHLFFLGISLILGIFNKSNFIWWINSLFLMIVSYLKFIKKTSWKKIRWLFFLPLAVGIYLISNFKIDSEIGVEHIFERITILFIQIKSILSGRMFYEYVIGTYPKNNWSNLYILVWGLIILIGGYFYLSRKNFKLKAIYFLLWLGLISNLFQVSLTFKATAPWHYFTIYPIISILMAVSLNEILNKINNWMLKIMLLTPLIFYLGFNYINYSRGFTGYLRNSTWSTKIEELVSYVRRENNKFIVLDWGVNDILILFDPVSSKYLETFGILSKPLNIDEQKWFIDNFLKDSTLKYIAHGESSAVFPNSRKIFGNIVRKNGFKLVLVKQISDIGRPDLFQIYKVIK